MRRPLVVALAALGVLIAAVAGLWAWLAVDLPDVGDLSAGLQTPSITITDRNGRLLYEVLAGGEARHTVVGLDEVAPACVAATIATEDAGFYTNPGVDFRAVVRAVWINLRGGEVISGGSTITQQVARNLLLDPQERSERSVTRKLREIILAYRLTRHYSKDDILALYLNQTDYGNLSTGIEAAARGYFGKSADELDLAECALLAGLPQAPSLYDPLTDPEAASERQSVVLGLMAERGAISEAEAESARREALAFAAERITIEAPHYVMEVTRQLEAALPPEALAAGGLEVRTTLDLDWQHAAERIARRHLELLNTPEAGDPAHNATDAALVALDPYTGQVRAMLGSPDYTDPTISGAVNMALAPRQPGSTMKPFTYALVMDPTRDSPWTASTMLLDVRTSFVTHDGFAYVPINYDREEHGPVLVREALASSYNVPAVITLDEVGVDKLLEFAARLGMDTLADPGDYDLSLTLGGGEVRLLDLTAGYAAFANGGQLVRPVLITEVRDADGEVIYHDSSGLGERIIDERVAWLISDILSDNLARAPGFTTHSILQIGRPAAVKTGTTTDFRDNWTVGYTPNLVVGVWVGNADHSPMVNISGVSGAGPIWHQFVRTVLRGQPELAFEQPEGLEQAEVCSLSGLLPTPSCPYTRREWFIAGTAPTQPDNLWRRATIDVETGLPAAVDTPPERQSEQLFLDLPASAQDWARREGLALLPESAALADASDGDSAAQGELIVASPDAYTVYRIDPALPRDSQKLRVVVLGPPGLHDVTLLVDGQPLAIVTAAPFGAYWPLAEGEHTVSARGTLADGTVLESTAVPFTVNPSDTASP
jgi:penicillin-binding protein 1C